MRELSPGELADVLESGKYRKGRQALCRSDVGDLTKGKLCCIGVYVLEAGIPYARTSSWGQHSILFYGMSVAGNTGNLRRDIAPEWMSIRFKDTSDDAQNHLIYLNDESENENDWTPVILYLRELQERIDNAPKEDAVRG